MVKDLKETLNLPKTDFPMRARLVEREPARLAHWNSIGLYDAIQEKNAGGSLFVLHDGPPYANGNIHMGHTLNKVLKDLILRYKSMRGYRTPYVPGWDCHGLPIEQQVLREIGDKIHQMEPAALRRLCHDYAAKWVDIQRKQFQRLGILGDWDRPYQTFDSSYEAGILQTLLELVRRDLVHRGHKAVHWDTVFRTALAEAEIEYHTHESPSIHVAMELLDHGQYPSLAGLDNAFFVIWTTTPWTIPANLGISLHPELDYVALQVPEGRNYIVARGLAEAFRTACGLENTREVAAFRAGGLDRARARHPIFPDRESLIMLGDHVTLEQGTGCVHTAPGHGADDFAIGVRYGLPVFVPVDEKGCFTADYPEMEGVFVFDANPAIVEKLRDSGHLLAHATVRHEYPYSWRSKKPIIFRATEQWFMDLTGKGVREKALEAIDHAVQWIPKWGCERIRSMVERRPEWCLSRQRHWGVPIPAFRSRRSEHSILDARVLERFIEIVKSEGTDAWYTRPLADFLPDDFRCEETGEYRAEDFEKEFDILDVWFDSGASHIAVLEQDERLEAPADLYLEGSDQHRGWFQSSLLTSIGARDRAPFRTVLTHGFIVDAGGRAMSKSAGNVISPLALIKSYGADILRLWVASLDYRNDAAISDEILRHVADSYRGLRNTLRFQISNLYDFDPERNRVPYASLDAIDKWALARTAELSRQVTAAYEAYEFQRVYQLCNQFCTVTLSATYHDILKDRLYTLGADDPLRRSSQTAVHDIFGCLVRMVAPILTFTADEAWSHSYGNKDFSDEPVHLQQWPEVPRDWDNSSVAEEIEQLLKFRGQVFEQLEGARQRKTIGKSLEAAVSIRVPKGSSQSDLLAKYDSFLPELFIVSAVFTSFGEFDGIEINVKHADGIRCPRCWRWVSELTQSADGTETCPRCKDAIHAFHPTTRIEQ